MAGRTLVSFSCALLLWLAACATPAFAQAIHDGKLIGTVASGDGAVLPGATVEIASPSLMRARAATTSATGTYVFLNLPIGRYTVTVSLAGFKTAVRENIEVSADATVTLDFVLAVGAVSETVKVIAEGPIVDTQSSTIDSRIDQELLTRIPTSRDAFLDLALTTPGMGEGSGAPTQTTEFQSPTAYGSSTNENVFLINGVNTTNPEAGSLAPSST